MTPVRAILTFIVILAVIGLVLWFVVTYIPMPELYRRIVIAVVSLLVLVWGIRWLGVQLAFW